MRAVGGEDIGDGLADAAGRAGDEGNFIVEIYFHAVLYASDWTRKPRLTDLSRHAIRPNASVEGRISSYNCRTERLSTTSIPHGCSHAPRRFPHHRPPGTGRY